MPPIESLRVHTVDFAHALRKRWLKRLDEQVIVIAHQASGPNAPIETPKHPAEIIDECLAVLVFQENIGSRVASRHDVVERTFKLDSERSGHRNNVPTHHVLCKYTDLNIPIIFDPSISVTNSAEVYWGYARYKPDPKRIIATHH